MSTVPACPTGDSRPRISTPIRTRICHVRSEGFAVRKGSALKNLAQALPVWVYVIDGAGSQNGDPEMVLSVH